MNARPAIGVLASGGLDSAVLLSHLLAQGERVQPLYVDCGLVWQAAELDALQEYLKAIATTSLTPLVVFELPLDDLYAGHWSVTGRDTPGAATADDAVYLPGRNLLLAIKPALWCQLHGISRLALGVLASNPFDDAGDSFFAAFEEALQRLGLPALKLERPLGHLHKREVMELGRDLPLGMTFSCIAPVDGQHCGRCNKCAERKSAFRDAGMSDPTEYAC